MAKKVVWLLVALPIAAALAIAVAARPGEGPQDVPGHFDGRSWWEYIKVLADDNMEGRETGSDGLRRAEAYVVEQLKKNGAEPAGSDGYYQAVKFESRQLIEKDSSAALVRDGKSESLTLGEDVIMGTRAETAQEVEAPMVFVGYGLRIPEQKYDDFAGLDLKGKVAVYISGSTSDTPAALSAHYQSIAERWKALRAAGAIGMVSILNPASMDIPWSRISGNRAEPSMVLAEPGFNDTEGLQVSLLVNPASAEKFFAGSPGSFAQIAQLAKDRDPLRHFPLAASLRVKATIEKKAVESANVVAKLPGSDASLKDQYVVLSAHVDHLGIGAPVNGDKIYNGAMDNASGDAVLLDVAASLKKSGQKLKRSLLFVFVTGEEKGLLGSRYFAAHPTVPANSMAADINIDMFLPLFPLKVLTVYGLQESDLGEMVTKVANDRGIRIQSDPEPLRNVFIRSDQYSFIRVGIPSLTMKVGFEKGSAEEQMVKDWRTNRYHAPSDDLNQPVDLSAAAAYEEVMRGLMIAVANDPQRPQWKQDSFFRRYAQPAGN
jgi:Zn-dependent M28 family amino/carboxypeptidase